MCRLAHIFGQDSEIFGDINEEEEAGGTQFFSSNPLLPHSYCVLRSQRTEVLKGVKQWSL